MHKDFVENVDETHFIVNYNNERILTAMNSTQGDTIIKYIDVVLEGIMMTLVVCITRGRRSKIEAPMIIFCNKKRMEKALFANYFFESCVYQGNRHRHMKHIWVDNCSRHNVYPMLETMLTNKHTYLYYLPPCTTDLYQRADLCVISKPKDA